MYTFAIYVANFMCNTDTSRRDPYSGKILFVIKPFKIEATQVSSL